MGLSLLQVIILAIVQGLTEFLPVSSSGHLVILESVMAQAGNSPGLEENIGLNIILHAGTLLSICVFYWSRILRLLGEDRRVIWLLGVGTIPAVVLGLPLKKFGAGILENPLLAGCMLLATGGVLVLTSFRKVEDGAYRDLSYGNTLLIGICQALAILPGLSRSGMTICSGITLGLSRRDAATFAFLLALPAIGGATCLEMVDLVKAHKEAAAVVSSEGAAPAASAEKALAVEESGKLPLTTLLAGFLTSFVIGIVSLWWVVRWIESDKLLYFAWWVLPVGIGVIIWRLLYF